MRYDAPASPALGARLVKLVGGPCDGRVVESELLCGGEFVAGDAAGRAVVYRREADRPAVARYAFLEGDRPAGDRPVRPVPLAVLVVGGTGERDGAGVGDALWRLSRRAGYTLGVALALGRAGAAAAALRWAADARVPAAWLPGPDDGTVAAAVRAAQAFDRLRPFPRHAVALFPGSPVEADVRALAARYAVPVWRPAACEPVPGAHALGP